MVAEPPEPAGEVLRWAAAAAVAESPGAALELLHWAAALPAELPVPAAKLLRSRDPGAAARRFLEESSPAPGFPT